ncbi:MAG: GxxExxY protein [Planctomycetaceae bacterium]|jgi:GxxExxY protein|nr:GxxExxY protein [Planctomycetaceae bacterium]MDG2391013.1 GxxExxY protein [Planctomycetaceae bacterium]
MHENDIGTKILDVTFEIHRELGPGLLESVYEIVLAEELKKKGFIVQRQVPVPIAYKGLSFEEGFRADLIIENSVIVELKSIESVSRVHAKQVLTYLKLLDFRLGYLINFGTELMKDGISRIVNGLETED